MTAPNVHHLIQEAAFRSWYAVQAQSLGLDPDPYNPLHFYDWRAAYEAKAAVDEAGHWPSTFKRLGHPSLVVKDPETGRHVDSRTMQPVDQDFINRNTAEYDRVVKEVSQHRPS